MLDADADALLIERVQRGVYLHLLLVGEIHLRHRSGNILTREQLIHARVQQRSFGCVFALDLRWHLRHQRHAAWAVDNALGSATADYFTVPHPVLHLIDRDLMLTYEKQLSRSF